MNSTINHEVVSFPHVSYWRIDREDFYADVEVELKLTTPVGLNRRDPRNRALDYIRTTMWDQGIEAANAFLQSNHMESLRL